MVVDWDVDLFRQRDLDGPDQVSDYDGDDTRTSTSLSAALNERCPQRTLVKGNSCEGRRRERASTSCVGRRSPHGVRYG
jgi:hypothetical protein